MPADLHVLRNIKRTEMCALYMALSRLSCLVVIGMDNLGVAQALRNDEWDLQRRWARVHSTDKQRQHGVASRVRDARK